MAHSDVTLNDLNYPLSVCFWPIIAQAVARAAGLHPVVHRVCVSADNARVERFSAPFFQRSAAEAMVPDHEKTKTNMKKLKKQKQKQKQKQVTVSQTNGAGSDGAVKMREFFQILKRRIYNTEDLNLYT